jgi:hypothetical protein
VAVSASGAPLNRDGLGLGGGGAVPLAVEFARPSALLVSVYVGPSEEL